MKNRVLFILALATLALSGCGGGGAPNGDGGGPLPSLPAPHARWTILIFMNAANDLQNYGLNDINELESIAQGSNVRFVVQWKQAPGVGGSTPSFVGTRRYYITSDQTSRIESQLWEDLGTSVDMGAPETLLDFVEWGKEQFPADRYGLIIWNHGSGWHPSRAVSFDDETRNAIQTHELRGALGANRFDFIAFDASLMQMMEVAYELRNHCDYVVGSEESPPGDGYPYHLAFMPFLQTPNASTQTLAGSFVDAMTSHPPYSSRKITQSVVRTDKLESLASALDQLALALIAQRDTIAPSFSAAIRNQTQSYSLSSSRHYYDIEDLALKLIANYPGNISTQANLVRNALREAVVKEGHNELSPGSHGLSIDLSPGTLFPVTILGPRYRLLQFSWTHWDEWLDIAP